MVFGDFSAIRGPIRIILEALDLLKEEINDVTEIY